MAQVKQDPQKLRSFCSELTGHVVYWETSIGRLEAQLSKLGESWRDDQFQEFRTEVLSLKQSLANFSEDTRRTVRALEKDAEKMEKYLNIKL